MNSEQFSNKLESSNLNSLTEILLKEISENKNDITPLFQLATVYVKLNELVKAINIYITLLEIDPDNENAKFEKDSIQAIVQQSQLDIMACTNTHMDPWMS